MAHSEPDSFQLNRITTYGTPGIIVLSSTYRLLYISQRATVLAGLLDSAFLQQPLPTALPDCLMDVTHEVYALQTRAATTGSPQLCQVNRVIGAASSNSVHVQVLLMPGSHKEDERIVLLLSQPHDAISLPTESRAQAPLNSSRSL